MFMFIIFVHVHVHVHALFDCCEVILLSTLIAIVCVIQATNKAHLPGVQQGLSYRPLLRPVSQGANKKPISQSSNEVPSPSLLTRPPVPLFRLHIPP